MPIVGVTKWDRIRNEAIRSRSGIEETLAEKVDRRVLRRFGNMERMDEGSLSRKVKAVTVGGNRREEGLGSVSCQVLARISSGLQRAQIP